MHSEQNKKSSTPCVSIYIYIYIYIMYNWILTPLCVKQNNKSIKMKSFKCTLDIIFFKQALHSMYINAHDNNGMLWIGPPNYFIFLGTPNKDFIIYSHVYS